MSVRGLAPHQQPVPVLGYCMLLAYVGMDFQLSLFPLREAGDGFLALFPTAASHCQEFKVVWRVAVESLRHLLGMAEEISLGC